MFMPMFQRKDFTSDLIASDEVKAGNTDAGVSFQLTHIQGNHSYVDGFIFLIFFRSNKKKRVCAQEAYYGG